MINPVIFPTNDIEADNRLIDIIITYMIEREMPILFAFEILKNNLRNKSLINCPELNEKLNLISNEILQ